MSKKRCTEGIENARVGYHGGMDSNQLRQFLAVAELEHVTNAAKRLNMTQPALTRALHKLEEQLHVRLFVHEGRNIRLTEEGAFLRDQVAPALAALDRAEESVRAFSLKEKDTVRLCIKSGSVLTVDAIALFAREHPEATFRVTQDELAEDNDLLVCSESATAAKAARTARSAEDGWSTEAFRSVEAAQPAESVPSASPGAPGNRPSRFRVPFEERVGVAVPAAQARRLSRGAQTIALERLAGARFIGLAGSQAFRALCESLCAAHGLAPDVAFESDNPSVVRKMIGLGLGVGFWPEHSWGPLGTDAAVWLPLRGVEFRRTVTVQLTPTGMEKPLARELHAGVVEMFRRAWSGADAGLGLAD